MVLFKVDSGRLVLFAVFEHLQILPRDAQTRLVPTGQAHRIPAAVVRIIDDDIRRDPRKYLEHTLQADAQSIIHSATR